MIIQGPQTRGENVRRITGMALLSAVASQAILHAEGIAISVWHCSPEAWPWWVEWFGELAGYMRWLSCASLGLP